MMPQRFQLSRRKGFDLQAASRALNGLSAVSVARPHVFGNPFRVADCREAGYRGTDTELSTRCVEAFRVWLGPGWRINWDGPESEAARAAILDALPRLRGKNLACWCRPGEPCHADVLLELANGVVDE